MSTRPNPLLGLPFEGGLEDLGPEYWDVVEAASFPLTRLRFRNDPLLHRLGLDPADVSDDDLEAAYGRFEGRAPLLALRYHGHQFGTYNPLLGDGRGFLYGQLRDRHGQLHELGTKGSGTTPWSRGGDGRLTLRGGVRELIAGEALHRLGVTTSRTLTLIETGEDLWRSDEPSPTRSSVMVRLARTHLRFGTCERLRFRRQPAQLERLLRHVVACHYPHLAALHGDGRQLLTAFYAELVQRVARLAAEWMAAGFTHGVLNTDNMSLAGESFDYGPFAFLDTWDPGFTAASFDHDGLYAFGRQPLACRHNLRLLQEPLAMLLPRAPLEAALEPFGELHDAHYRRCLLRRLGFDPAVINAEAVADRPDPVPPTLRLLAGWPVAYGAFFAGLARRIGSGGLPATAEDLEPFVVGAPAPPRAAWLAWRDGWWHWAQAAVSPPGGTAEAAIAAGLERRNLPETPVRPVIERIWAAIDERDDWAPLQQWLATTVSPETDTAG
jgi:uncharacterized protein YdiU (UPF0061 family)